MQHDSYQIDLARESPLEITAMAELLAKFQGRSKPWHHNQVRRQFKTGCHGIPIPSLLVGMRRISTRGAALWWIAAVTAAAANADRNQGETGVAAPLTPAERRALEVAGIPTEAA